MRSNLCRIVGLLSVFCLAAIFGASVYDVSENSRGCYSGLRCKNGARVEVVVYSRRSLLARRFSVGDSTVLHFAKRRPSGSATSGSSVGQNSAEVLFSVADSPGSVVVVSAAEYLPPPEPDSHTERAHARASPVKAPAPAPSPLEPVVTPSPEPVVTPSPEPVVPPPLNFTYPADCRQACPDGYTYTPPGAPSCSCVIPMHAQFRLGIKLERLFPLVSELAKELAGGLFLQTSQVRIVGANAVLDDTDVSADFVPLDTKFDNTTAHLLASRLWSGQVPLNETLFGTYYVIFVSYPGLPAPPPAEGSVSAPAPAPAYELPAGEGGSHKLSAGLIAVIALASAMGVLLSIGFVWLYLLRRSLNEKTAPSVVGPLHTYFNPKPEGSLLSGSMASSTTISYESSMANYTGTTKIFSLAELERATDHFRPDNVVGEGGFGQVFQGVLDSGIEVAVKVLKRDDLQGGREFIAEVEMLSRLHHRNLVKLIGICTEEMRCLVYELITNGSVESHLHGIDKYTSPLNWEARVKIALGAARGLAYLHEESQPRVIHRDFKGSNILLEDDYSPKVSDFGLAKAAAEGGKEHISTRVMGTFGYVAPEYAMTGHLLVKSDVYSYGVVLLELLSGRKPVDMSQPAGEENLVTWARPLLTSQEGLEELVDPYLGDRFPFDSFAKVAAIASMCVQPEVSHRPFMGEVVQALKMLYNAEPEGARSEVTSSWLRGASSHSNLIEPHHSESFLHDASFISSDYDSGPFESLDLQGERKRKPLSASATMTSSSGMFRQHSGGSLRRFSASAPPKASSLPRTLWQALRGGQNPNCKPGGSECFQSERPGDLRFLDPERRRFYSGFWP